ncbi:MAG: prepilin-type N-terminal cleavage/methylation domain-containing protein [Candidatus Omnitrophica bacterium]|nr:prepilin-type N-terminal cleavage/methylation domain-containing protein [Candidatus Omnitrophota bacterium]
MELKQVVKCPEGFSLVELLLGLAISAIIGVSVYNLFWSAMKLDDKMRRVHDNYMEVLMADQVMTRDLENAISLDWRNSYWDAKNFVGQKTEFAFLTQTPVGIKHVRYYSGLVDWGKVTQRMIGRLTNPSSFETRLKESIPVEFLLRQESSLSDWLNEVKNNTSIQIVAAGLKKDTFNCHYAPFLKDLHTVGAGRIVYTDSWDKKVLPFAVSCSFVLYDPKKPQAGLMFKRDMFLAPVSNYYNEQ